VVDVVYLDMEECVEAVTALWLELCIDEWYTVPVEEDALEAVAEELAEEKLVPCPEL
jgi:hypothetical protein